MPLPAIDQLISRCRALAAVWNVMTADTINLVRDALKLSLIQQAVALVFSALVLDDGSLFLIVIFALAAFWTGTAMVLSRHGRPISRFDVFLLKWGFFPICIFSFFLARWIWILRGYHTA